MEGHALQFRGDSFAEAETIPCFTAIFRDSQIFLVEAHGCHSLPSLRIRKKQRVAPNILPAIDARYGLSTIGRFSFVPEGLTSEAICVVVDSLGEANAREGVWCAIDALGRVDLQPEIHELIHKILVQARSYENSPRRFASSDWFQQVRSWTECCLAMRDWAIDGPATQFNMGPDFSLLRFQTTGPVVWFKAVGSPNEREFTVTQKLASMRLPHVPEILDVQPSWNAWMMPEAPGCSVDESHAKDKWLVVARSLAELQLAAATHTTCLLAEGCIDLRTSSLLRQIEPYLSGVAQLMAMQKSAAVRRLELEDLLLMERRLKAACRQAEASCIPDTLGHSDFNAGNIFVGRDDVTFLDWAQGHVGFPFLTLEYLLLLVRRVSRFDQGERLAALREYLRPWESICSGEQIVRALEVTPILAVFAYALVCGGSRQEVYTGAAQLPGYLRALARRVHLEAKKLGSGSKISRSEI